MNIILIGFKNSGKTTLGKEVAELFSMSFVDTDDLICQQFPTADLSIKQIYNKVGDRIFRELELAAIKSLEGTNKTIIATGGGCVTHRPSVKVLKTLGNLIYLNMPAGLLLTRMQKQTLPTFIDPDNVIESFTDIYKARHCLYSLAADFEIDGRNKARQTIIYDLETIIYEIG